MPVDRLDKSNEKEPKSNVNPMHYCQTDILLHMSIDYYQCLLSLQHAT